MQRAVFVGCALAVLAAFPARACINDRDTLADEAQKFPDAVRVITGRFPRNPPLYYRMRIRREGADLRLHPNRLDEYDDVAAAWDRLGDDTAALAVMEKKRARLQASGQTPQPNSGDTPWYRYYANTGTFHAHLWLRSQGKRPLSEVQDARAMIARAIQLNPNAHFGREPVQLMVMDWLLVTQPESPAYANSNAPLEQFIRERLPSGTGSASSTTAKAAQGLSGLVVLGGAWESPDVFDALAWMLRYSGQWSMAQFAEEREDELLRQGHMSLLPEHPYGRWRDETPPVPQPLETPPAWSVRANYTRLRAEAERWQKARINYMMLRLQAGRHPDTDPTFWKDWHDPPAPEPANQPWPQRVTNRLVNRYPLAFLALVAAVILLVMDGVRFILNGKRRRKLTAGDIAVTAMALTITALLLFPMFAKTR